MDKQSSAARERSAAIESMSELHHFSEVELDHLKILHRHTRNTAALEAMRDIRTQLMAAAEGRNFSCLVTTPVSGGGASHVAKNLAAVIAMDDTKTSVLVDANFYAPSVNELVQTEIDRGLNAYLSTPDMGIESIVYASGIPRVRVVPVGGDSSLATEHLSSVKAQQLVPSLKRRYVDRYVVVDAPPVLQHPADNRLLCQHCDFVILVVPFGRVSQSQLRQCEDALSPYLSMALFNY